MRTTASAGFSLLEVLVALAIFALSLGALYQAAGGSVRGAQAADEHSKAVLLARSLLALHDLAPPGGASLTGVDESGLEWRVNIVPLPADSQRPGLWPLHRVEAEVIWGEGAQTRLFVLSSLIPERPESGLK